MITYNQETFVRQAVQSVFSQKTDFEFEVVIGDDASKDGTAAIISSLTPPEGVLLNFIRRGANLGMLPNFVSTLAQCSGQYVALLEGDDYWIDANKLQRQVDFLDANPDFSICYHPVKIDKGTGRLMEEDGVVERDVSDIYDLAKGNFMHTCSVVFRAKLFNEFPETFFSSTVGDYFLHMLNAQYGKIKKLPLTMGVYRIHEGGVWSLQPNMDLKILTYLEAMADCFNPDVDLILKNRHKMIAAKSFFSRLSEEEFEQRLRRCCIFGSDVFQVELINRLSNRESRYFCDRFKSVLRRFIA
jgi:glycosyltransferase involved in cell wall biosynthesis